jgi:hypothetical protein
MKIISLAAALFHADRKTDGHTGGAQPDGRHERQKWILSILRKRLILLRYFSVFSNYIYINNFINIKLHCLMKIVLFFSASF